MLMKITCALLFSGMAGGAIADSSAIKDYRQETENGYLDCKTTAFVEGTKTSIFLMSGKRPMGDDGLIYECADRRTKAARDLLTAALAELSKDDATKALKLYHVAYSTALKGLVQGSSESESQYGNRKQTLRSKMDEAWSLFELEQ